MERGAQRIGYARVSTEDQNLSLQLDALRAAGCSRVFCDEGISGITRSRPALDRVLANLQRGDTLVTWKLDRLGRSLAHLIQIIDGLRRRRIGFCSLSEAIDTATPGGKLVFHVLGALAEFERELIAERTKAGMAAAKARGVTLGCPTKLTAGETERAGREIVAGGDVEEVARRFGVSPVTLARALKRSEALS
jgi:DNA invertase Pin-like site-specific DNA recombinase